MSRTLACTRPRAAVILLLLAALLAGSGRAQAAVGALADSRCPPAALVDPAFRDAALQALQGLLVRAPGQAADGAVLSHHSAGHVDDQARPWHQVSAYQVNLGLMGALRVSPGLLPAVEGWLQWQARHMAATGPLRGVVLDHWVRTDTREESICPPGIEARLCGHVDAHDSTAASTLLMADAYLRHGGRVAVLRDPILRAALEAAAAALRELTSAEGLTWALPSHRVAYTMDAVEVIAGWRAWSRVQRHAYAEPASADNTMVLAARAQAALDTLLWDRAHGSWRVSAEAGRPDKTRWYPDTVAQAWPLLWGHEPARRERDVLAWRQAIAPWQSPASHWADHVADPAGFLWPAVAVAAHCTGDSAVAQRWVARARQHWLNSDNPENPFAWPFQVGDLLWLFWLADARDAPAAGPATPIPRVHDPRPGGTS